MRHEYFISPAGGKAQHSMHSATPVMYDMPLTNDDYCSVTNV